MTTSRDVAQYLLEQYGPMDTWKLQKLVYYVQAWHLAEHDEIAFDDVIEAFADGPVAVDLFHAHQTLRTVSRIHKGHASHVGPTVREIVSEVWDSFGSESGRTLRELTHAEAAWLQARGPLADDAPSEEPLSEELMKKSAIEYRQALRSIPAPMADQDLDDYLRSVASQRA